MLRVWKTRGMLIAANTVVTLDRDYDIEMNIHSRNNKTLVKVTLHIQKYCLWSLGYKTIFAEYFIDAGNAL